MEQIPVIIKSLRENNGFTQTEVARHLEISQQAYSNYELSKRELPSRHAISLSRLYKVSADYILGNGSGYTGPYDLESIYIQGITLKDMLHNLKVLNTDNRKEAVRYIAYLKAVQSQKK